MKKVSVVRANVKPLPPLSAKNLNMKHCYGDQEKNKEICQSDVDCMVESQAQYIENLQQQIYVLENEVGYLRTYLHESNKQHPSMIAEGEKMVKKLAECHNEIKSMKVELKKKQTIVDMVRSERDRIQRYKEELEEKFRKEKCRLLEEIISVRKERDAEMEKSADLEQQLQNWKQNERNLQETVDSSKISLEQKEREKLHDKEIISTLLQEKELLQKEVLQMRMIEQAKPNKGAETIMALKETIQELHEMSEACKRSAEHEQLLRERLSEDNSKLIKRYAELESEFAEVKARLREEEIRRTSLEKLHLSTVVEASEAKNRDESLKQEIDQLNEKLKEESEHSYNLALRLADEQRFKAREEERYSHVSKKFEHKEEQMKQREIENIELMRDNTFYKEQVLQLKEQVKTREDEVVNLKQKVQEMQVNVEEFIQSTQNANRLAGERWKQLGQLAQGITALTSIAESSP